MWLWKVFVNVDWNEGSCNEKIGYWEWYDECVGNCL